MAVWQLDDYQDNIDLREDIDGNFQYRNHYTLTRTQIRPARGRWSSDVGKFTSSLLYHIGGILKFKRMAGTNRYLCIHDGIRPHGIRGKEIITRTQVWEHYGAFQTISFTG